jgi:hypothetical protein
MCFLKKIQATFPAAEETAAAFAIEQNTAGISYNNGRLLVPFRRNRIVVKNLRLLSEHKAGIVLNIIQEIFINITLGQGPGCIADAQHRNKNGKRCTRFIDIHGAGYLVVMLKK